SKKEAKRTVTEAAAQTFGVIAQEYLDRQIAEGRAAATVTKNRWLLEDLASQLTDRPIAAITPSEILAVLRSIEARGRLESAQRARSAIARVFRHAIRTARATADPTVALSGATTPPIVRHRAAITAPARVGELLRAIDGMEDSPVVKPALQLMALCFPRPGELRFAEWSEIDFDKAVWSVPAERSKMRRAHAIPLAPQALTILRGM